VLNGLSVMETANQLKTSQSNKFLLVALIVQVLVLFGHSEITTVKVKVYQSKVISTKLVTKELVVKFMDGLKEIRLPLTCQESKVISIKLDHKPSVVKFME
jgi:hypothetical protein